jgi:tetratricopeptide (TPR) repeat protein
LRHEAKVLHAEFSPDGRRLLTATEWAVRVWDAATGEPLTPALRPGSHISAAAFLPEPLLSDPSLVRRYRRYGDLKWPGIRVNVATFSSDGRHVLVFNDANQVRVWDLSPDNRPVDDLERLVTLLSGRKIDATGTSVPIAAMESDWQQLKAAYPEAFTVPEQQVIAWRQAEKQEKEQAKKEAPKLYARRGQAYAEQNRLAEAAADLTRAIELGHDDVRTWTTLALVRLASKDDTGYRQARADMLKRFGKTQDARTAGVFAWNYCLAPAARSEFELVLKMHQTVAPDDLPPRGLLLYRLGRFKEAVKQLKESIARSPNKEGRGADWLFLAMAHHRLGHNEEAKSWLAKAVPYMEQTKARDWREWQELQILHREADALINAKGTEPKK